MSKTNKKRRIWIPILAVVLAAALVAGGVAIWRSATGKAVAVYPVMNIYDTYWGDDISLSGNVSTGSVQNVALRDSLIESINVQVGDTVSAGDVLMVYDTTSFELTLQSDRAKIAVLESNIQQTNRDISKYRSLRPSEEAPQPTEEVVDHGPLNIRATVDASHFTGDGQVFQCTGDTVVTAAFLQQLRASGASVEFQLYEDNLLYGSWMVDGSVLPTTRVEYIPVEAPPPTPSDPEDGSSEGTDPGTGTDTPGDGDPSGEGEGSGTPDEPAASSETSASAQTTYIRQEVEALDSDWTLGGNLIFTGDGVSVDLSAESAGYGQFVSCSPTEYQQYETIYHDNYVPDGSENYMYSREELKQMIQQAEQELASYQLDLQAAQLTYQQDQLVSQTGEVTATIDGTVTEVKDAAALASGDTLISVKGTENYTITAYISEMNLSNVAVGDSLSAYTYESGNNVMATITEIGDTPADYYSYGMENPNNSYYPITAAVEDQEVELTVGEWCDVTLMSSSDGAESQAIYLPLMYVRSDDGGSYVMLADENNRLKKQYVRTGKTLWGSSIEIKSGVSLEDRVAFPYGKSVREGARITDQDYPQY